MNIINNDLEHLATVFKRATKHGADAQQRYIKIEENHSIFTRRRKERSSLKEVFEHAQKQIQDAVCSCSIDDIEKTQKALNKIKLATETLRARYDDRAGNLFVRLRLITPREKRKTLESADQLLIKVEAASRIVSKISEGNEDALSLKWHFKRLCGDDLDFTLQLLKSSEKGKTFESYREILEDIATDQLLRPLHSFGWHSYDDKPRIQQQKKDQHFNKLSAYLPYINYRKVDIFTPYKFNGVAAFQPLQTVCNNLTQPQTIVLPTSIRAYELPIWKKIARDLGLQSLLIEVYYAETKKALTGHNVALALVDLPKLIRKPWERIGLFHIDALQMLIKSGLLQNDEFRRETGLDGPLFRDLVDLNKPWTSEDYLSRALLNIMKKLNSEEPIKLKEAKKLLDNVFELDELEEALHFKEFTKQELESLHRLVQEGLLENENHLDTLPMLCDVFSDNPESVEEYNLQTAALHYIFQVAKLTDIENAKKVWKTILQLNRLNEIDFDYIWGVEEYRSLLRLSRSEVIKEEKFIELFGSRFPLLMTLVKQGNYKPLPASISLEPDLKLYGKDDVEVMAILPLMAMVSKYFESMLNHNFLETHADFRLACIEEFKGNILSYIVQYAETGTLPVHLSSDMLFILKKAAEYFTMPKLCDHIDSIVRFIDPPENVTP